MNGLRILVTTLQKEEHAAEIVRTLVRERFVACGTLFRKARSIYIWKDQMEDSEEVVVVLKTTESAAHAAIARLLELHPYEVPEILEFSPGSVPAAYMNWVEENVGS